MERSPAARRLVGRLKKEHLPLLLALGIVLVLGVHNDIQRSLAVEESYSLDTAARDLPGTFRQAIRFELQAPLYFVLLHFWLKVSASIEFARLLSTALALLSLCVLHRTAGVLAIRSRYLSLPLLAALCPQFLWAASEARGYALTILLTSCLTFYFVKIFFAEGEARFRDGVLYVLTAYLALLTFYYTGFLLAAQFVAGLLAGRRRRALVPAFAALAVLMMPWVPTILGQAAAQPNFLARVEFHGADRVAASLAAAEWFLWTLLTAIFVAPSRRAALVLSVAALFPAAAVAARTWRRGNRWSREETMLAISAGVPVLLLLLLRVTSVSLVEGRHWVFVIVNVLAFAVLLIDRVPVPSLSRGLGAVLLLIFGLAALRYQLTNRAPGEWRSATAFVMERERSGEPILFFHPYGVLPFRYYYRGPNALHGIPMDMPLDEYSLENFTIRSERELLGRLSHVVGPERAFWLVEPIPHEPPLGAEILERVVREKLEALGSGGERVVGEFQGVWVSRLRTPAAFR